MTDETPPNKRYGLIVTSTGVALIDAPSKAAAARLARTGQFDSYELRKPVAMVSTLAEGGPTSPMLPPVEQPVVFRA